MDRSISWRAFSFIHRLKLPLVPDACAMAGFFVILNAEFLAVIQVLIYAGAISILIIFAIMMTRDVAHGNLSNRLQPVAFLAALLLLVAILFVVLVPYDVDATKLIKHHTQYEKHRSDLRSNYLAS